MKITNKTYTVDLMEEEIEEVTTALHGEYKFVQGLHDKETDDKERRRLYLRQKMIRELRNDFGRIINRFYSGEDA